MFERVGGVADEDAGRRHAVSLALTATLGGAAIGGFLLGTLSWAVVAAPAGPGASDEQMVYLDLPVEPAAASPLPPVPVAVPPAAAAPDPPAEIDGAAEPEPTPTPGLSSGGPTPGLSSGGPTAGSGSEGGGADAAAASVAGVVDESDGAALTGDCKDCATSSTPSEGAVVRKMVQPEYPAAARALGLADQRCTVRVEVDERGVPDSVEVEGCPEAFHQATREGVLQWRWYPSRAAGVPSRAAATVAVTYRLTD
jgi:hypothetical protein